MYWMHLEVAAETTLTVLDRFLRDTWLECCGHLSVFRIGGFNYYVDADTDAGWDWDLRRKNMQAKLEEVLSPGQTCSYEYDFGSTTELLVKVVEEREAFMKGKAIQVLARNIPPFVPCDICGKPAAQICTQLSMKTKDACVMGAQKATNVTKRCCYHWSIHLALAYAAIQARTQRMSGSRLFQTQRSVC
jgi:hypothetical protein